MWSTIAKRNSKPLTGPQCNINTKLSRRLQNSKSHQISGTYGQCSIVTRIRNINTKMTCVLYNLLCSLNNLGEIMNASLRIRVLEDDTTDILPGEVHIVDIHHLYLDTKRPGSCLHTADCLRMQLIRQEKPGDINYQL